MSIGSALELSVLFVCIWGFIAIILTGQFSIFVIVGCIVALLIGYRARSKGWLPSPLIANVSAILVFLIAVFIYVTTMNLLVATVHLFLFLQVTKYITRRSVTENRWCYIISLFNVIGASVITTAVTFGIMLVVYIFMVMMSLRLFVIASEIEKNQKLNSGIKEISSAVSVRTRTADILRKIPLPRGYILTGGVLTLVILLVSGALFSAIPRLATQNLFQSYGPPQKEPAVSAFSENVEFGSFTEIQQDDALALFVQPIGKTRPTNVRMRGVALDTFNGKAWSRTGFETSKSGAYDYQPIFTTRSNGHKYKYRIIQPPGVTNFLFGDSFPTEIRLPPSFLFQVDQMAQTVYLPEMPPKEFQYEVKSIHEELSQRKDPTSITNLERPASHLMIHNNIYRESEHSKPTTSSLLRQFFRQIRQAQADETSASRRWNNTQSVEDADTNSTESNQERRQHRIQYRNGSGSENWYIAQQRSQRTGREILMDYLHKCLDVPENLSNGRVAELARNWSEDEPTTFTKAIAIERHLRSEYGYSLTPRARGNYIDSFLFDVREGHCEYFATSMAVLLRNIGIPARVVNGYYSSEWNPLSGNFTVRQKDAHSWVEAWMSDRYGWMTFDPTPPGGVSRRINRGAIIMSVSRFADAVKMRWYRYVVDYTISDQVMAMHSILEWRRRLMVSLKTISIFGISGDDAMPISLGSFSGEIDWRPVAASGLIIMFILIWQGIRWIGRRKRSRVTKIKFYDDLLRILRKQGVTMAPGQTPMEFAQQLSAANPNWNDIIPATAIYYKYRFHKTKNVTDPEETAVISSLKKSIKQGNP